MMDAHLLALCAMEARVLMCVASLPLRSWRRCSCRRRAASTESSCESLVALTLLCVVVRRTPPAMDNK